LKFFTKKCLKGDRFSHTIHRRRKEEKGRKRERTKHFWSRKGKTREKEMVAGEERRRQEQVEWNEKNLKKIEKE